MNLLLVGSRYLPYRHEGDKNFWLELVERIKPKVKEVHLLSLTYDIEGCQFYEPNVWVHSITPVPFLGLRPKFSDNRLRSTNNYISRSLSFVKASREIRRVCQRHDIDVVQFMENYGPAMLLMPLARVRVPSSALVGGYYPRLPVYSVMLKLWGKIFARIIPSTGAVRQKLLEIGLSEEQVSERIGWGIDVSRMRRAAGPREEIRAQLGIDSQSTLVLWSGFLQQTSFREFQYSLEIASEILNLSHSVSFIFCFKQVHFKREFLRCAQDRLAIISAESSEEFLNLVNASDMFLSPYLADDAILTPPLTWLECLAHEVPIITTDIAGVRELITSGYNGYIARSKEEMVKCILNLIADEERLRTMRANAREFVCQNYDIAQVATKFLRLWQGIKA